MDNDQFIELVRLLVSKLGMQAVKQNITKPAGRSPQAKYLVMSSFYNSRNNEEKEIVDLIIKESVDTAIFQFLCMLDGVIAIENEKEGGLKLYYESNSKRVLINDPDHDYLHDIFKSE